MILKKETWDKLKIEDKININCYQNLVEQRTTQMIILAAFSSVLSILHSFFAFIIGYKSIAITSFIYSGMYWIISVAFVILIFWLRIKQKKKVIEKYERNN